MSSPEPEAASFTDPLPAAELAPILAHLNAGPSRTWSLIITLIGDSIVPRQRAVWLGTLLELFRAIDIGDGVVRTAMSRLTADGWLERTKIGRNSYYRLAAHGEADFARATEKIYTRRPPPWHGYFDMVVDCAAGDESWPRRAAEAGYGSLGADIWIAPAIAETPVDGIRVRLAGEPDELRALASRAWDLSATAQAYRRFLAVFEPLQIALQSGHALTPRDCLLARMLLIHAYRRIVLRDPLLPPEVLPADWPGTSARRLCAAIYRQLLDPSERWLDANAIGEDGSPLAANPQVVGARFRD